MDDLLKNSKIKDKIWRNSEEFIRELLKKPKEVNRITDQFFSELFKTCGLDEDFLGEAFKDLSEEQRAIIRDKLCSFEIVFMILPVKKYNDEFSLKIDELFIKCKVKDLDKLGQIFKKSRLELMRKLLLIWSRSWRIVSEKGWPKEAVLDNKLRIAKSFSEGIYREFLTVIQEMMQISLGYKPTDKFGTIINQLEKAPTDLKVFINKTAYNIRNAESHENVEFEKNNNITLYDNNGKVIQRLTEKELDKTIKWLTNFTNSVFHSLQKNYFDYAKIGPKVEDKIEHMIECILELLVE
jgi:hypothetical protein